MSSGSYQSFDLPNKGSLPLFLSLRVDHTGKFHDRRHIDKTSHVLQRFKYYWVISVTVISRTPEAMDTSYVRLLPLESLIVKRPR